MKEKWKITSNLWWKNRVIYIKIEDRKNIYKVYDKGRIFRK